MLRDRTADGDPSEIDRVTSMKQLHPRLDRRNPTEVWGSMNRDPKCQ